MYGLGDYRKSWSVKFILHLSYQGNVGPYSWLWMEDKADIAEWNRQKMKNNSFLFLLRWCTLSSLRNGPHQKHYSSFGFTWFLWPLWCARAALFYFEKRYQKSSTSLRLRLVVRNRKFQWGHNPSSFKFPLCGISKTWTNIGFLLICCFDKVTGYKESIIEPLDVVH